jgi:hypothetical protein
MDNQKKKEYIIEHVKNGIEFVMNNIIHQKIINQK